MVVVEVGEKVGKEMGKEMEKEMGKEMGKEVVVRGREEKQLRQRYQRPRS